MPEREKVLVKALCDAEDRHCEKQGHEDQWLKSFCMRRQKRILARQWDAEHKPGKGSTLLRPVLIYDHEEELTTIFFFLSSSSRRGCLDARSSPLLHACALWSAVPRPQSCRGGLDRCSSLQHLTTQFLNTYLTSGIGTQWNLGQICRTHCFLKAVQNSVIKSSCIKVNGNHLSKSNSLKQSLHLQYTNVIPAGTVLQLPSESDYLACTEELFPYKSPLLNDATSPKGSDSSTQLT